ncbi:hypothetical protein [Paenibacillus kobensis]|uniref:hypothetical protein n=1 Tax=Paenibacillus kobensis TaxID=59841 RepID=UPI000FDB2BEF|nr:hypothetical protein [Paenibacillus kobensis]
MIHDLEQAKALFMTYFGNRQLMHREGKWTAYRSMNVDPAVEAEWLVQMMERYLADLSIRNWDAIANLALLARNYPAGESMVNRVTAFVSRHLMSADSIVKLHYAEHFTELIQKYRDQLVQEELYAAYKAIELLLLDVQTAPLVIDPGHELSQYGLKDKRTLNNRAQRGLDELYRIIG